MQIKGALGSPPGICFVCGASCCVCQCFCVMVCKKKKKRGRAQLGWGGPPRTQISIPSAHSAKAPVLLWDQPVACRRSCMLIALAAPRFAPKYTPILPLPWFVPEISLWVLGFLVYVSHLAELKSRPSSVSILITLSFHAGCRPTHVFFRGLGG